MPFRLLSSLRAYRIVMGFDWIYRATRLSQSIYQMVLTRPLLLQSAAF